MRYQNMLICVKSAPPGTNFAAPTFLMSLLKEVTVPAAANFPLVIDIVGGTDDDLKKLAALPGFVFEKVTEEPARARSWHGRDHVE